MKNSSLLKDFSKYTASNVIAMIGMSCYILADTFFISWGLGQNGLAALNICMPSFNIIFAIGLMLGIGGGTRFAIFKSTNDQKHADEIFTHTIFITAFLSIIFVVLGASAPYQLSYALGANADTIDLCAPYTMVIVCFSPFFMFNNVVQSFVRNDNAPRLAMVAMIAGNIFNILFDYILIFPCKLGMLGAALATAFSPIVSLLIMSIHFLRKKNTFHFSKCKPSITLVGKICSSGFPSMLAEASLAVTAFLFNRILLDIGSTVAVAAYGVILNVYLVTNAIFNGIAQGVQPLLSENYGKGNVQNTKKLLAYSIVTTAVFAVAMYTALYFGADGVTLIFNQQKDVLLQSLAPYGIQLFFISVLFSGFSVIFASFFVATTKTVLSQMITLIRGYATIIPLVFLLSSQLGVKGVWLTTPIAEAITLVIATLMLAKVIKKLNVFPRGDLSSMSYKSTVNIPFDTTLTP